MSNRAFLTIRLMVIVGLILPGGCARTKHARSIVTPEETRVYYHNPESLPFTPLESFANPRTVTHPLNGLGTLELSLDEAIRIALQNSEVVRVLTGTTASSSGRTVYDPAIASTTVDQARGRFDPNLSINNTFNQNESAQSFAIPLAPGAAIREAQTDSYVLDSSLTDLNTLGGTSSLRLGITHSDTEPDLIPINPQTNHFAELSYVQPLLQGAGHQANLAPVLIAKIDTERSFFQFKLSIQRLVQSVINGYWNLVSARTIRWAREQQVNQAQFAYDREVSRKARGLGDLSDVAQTKTALTNFKANYVVAKSNVIQSEAALLNVLGISPTEIGEVIPITPPHDQRVAYNWDELIALAERFRPDLIELKLILEADQQRVILANNQAKPNLDAVALYRWDGLEGRTPTGNAIGSNGIADWTLGVNFSVPLGLRQARANLRQQELILLRDRANLEQGLHNAIHQLALSIRDQDRLFDQYQALLEARDASSDNLRVQKAEFKAGRTIPLNVLQAISDWGNAVSAQAQSLTQYNSELANLELQSGTILEVHGVRFMEERQRFVGPCGIINESKCYPAAIHPTENQQLYPFGEEPAEEAFDLDDPLANSPFEKNSSSQNEDESLPEQLSDTEIFESLPLLLDPEAPF